MKWTIVLLAVLAPALARRHFDFANFSSGARLLPVKEAPAHAVVDKVCGGASVAHTVSGVALREDGVKITMGTCSPGLRGSSRGLDSRATKVPLPDSREAGDECATPCRTVCFKGTQSPVSADCQVVFNALAEGNKNFTLPNNNFVLYTYQTCGTSFTNQIAGGTEPQELSSCYSDWKTVGQDIASQCTSDAGFAGGKCVARYGSFVAVPDWYLMVYNT
ncbi:hypothetical protein BKA62DRAFT_148581 [Auriculariales sp. MPI-PUGE-AT-0066]|nr:hypothetical protein BKA62DRAFT_148581 [Auriculariales sp. MPI-PUGE-AT-0066]